MTNEMKKALQERCEKNNLPLEETRIAARYLEKNRDILPEALPALAEEFQWTLQHNVDSYGCDYDWVYSEDGLDYILTTQFSIPRWATDRESYNAEFGIEPTEKKTYEFFYEGDFLKNVISRMKTCFDNQYCTDDYLGSARTGDICFDFVVRDDRTADNPNEIYLNIDLYVGGIDSGYGYSDRNPETPNYPYDYREGCGGYLWEYLDHDLGELIELLEKEMTEYLNGIKDEDVRAAIARPLHYW